MMSSLASLVVRRRRSAFSVPSPSFGAGPSTESCRVTERLDEGESVGTRSR
jgi:hypothetical protein